MEESPVWQGFLSFARHASRMRSGPRPRCQPTMLSDGSHRDDVGAGDEVGPILHEVAPLLELLTALVCGRCLGLVLVRKRCLPNAVGIVRAFLGPGREGRSEACTVTWP
jgi:hypothetical protein